MTSQANDMSVSVETMDGLNRRMKITIPKIDIDQDVNAKLKELTKTARIDGFRPGKAPLSVIRKHYHDAAFSDAVNKIVYRSLSTAFEKADIEPAGNPTIESIDAKPDTDLTYSVLFEVLPDITLSNFSDVSVIRRQASIADEDVEKTIKTMREQYATFESVDRSAQLDDQVTLDFRGLLDGEPFQGGEAKEHKLVLGSNTFIPGFEDALIGCCIKDEKSIDLQFPDDYHAKDLAGKPVVFEVVIHAVSEKKLPELNDEFFEKFDLKGDEKNLDVFRSKVRENMQRELDQRLLNEFKKALFDALLALHDFAVPDSLLERSLDRKQAEFMEQFKQYMGGKDHKLPPLDRELFREEVTHDIRLGLLFSTIVEQFELKAESDKVEAKIAEQAELYADPDAFKQKVKQSPEQQQQFEALVLEQAVIDIITEKAKIEEKTVSYQDVMNPKKETDE